MSDAGSSVRTRWVLAAVAAGFMAALWAPMVFTALGCRERVQIMEVRKTPVRPAFAWGALEKFPEAFADYFADAFAYRLTLSRVYGLVKVKLFHVSPTEKVLLGKDNWLYFTGSRKIEDYEGLSAPSADELARWQTWIAGREAYLAARGIDYHFVQVPNKITIYPEYVPNAIRRKEPGTRLDALAPFLEAHHVRSFLDLRPTLQDARREGLVYYETGTHWNHLGAYAAYARLCQELRGAVPSLQPIGRDAFAVGEAPGESICRMMCLEDADFEIPMAPRLLLRETHAQRVPFALPVGFPPGNYSLFATACDGVPRTLLVLHDSFLVDFMRRVLPEHFGRTVWMRSNGSLDHARFVALVEAVKPDVVIEECVERFMITTPPIEPAYAEALSRRGDS